MRASISTVCDKAVLATPPEPLKSNMNRPDRILFSRHGLRAVCRSAACCLALILLAMPIGCEPPPRPNFDVGGSRPVEDELASMLRDGRSAEPTAPSAPIEPPIDPAAGQPNPRPAAVENLPSAGLSSTDPTGVSAADESVPSGESVLPERATPSPLVAADLTAPRPTATKPTGESASTKAPNADSPQSSSVAPLLDAFRDGNQAPWEVWQALYLGGRHVGFSHMRVEPDKESAGGNLRVTMSDQVSLRRGSSTVLQRFDQTTIESPDGELRSLQAELRVGPAVTRYVGKVEAEKLVLELTRGSKSSQIELRWRADYRGPLGVQQSLRQQPLGLGQRRELRALMPIRFVPAKTSLNCQHRAAIAMPDGSVVDALEIEVEMALSGDQPPLQSVIWTDDRGRPIKTYNSAIDLVGFTTSREAAMADLVSSADILSVSSIDVDGELENPDRVAWVVYQLDPRAKPSDAGEAVAIRPQPGQWVRKASSGAYQLFVADRPPPENYGRFVTTSLEPIQADIRPNALIDSDDPMIIQLARSALIPNASVKDKAISLAFAAHSMIDLKGYAEGFRPASQVARSETGDCTAHAVLLAALLRSQGIPARVAIGLVFVPTEAGGRMAYHMWTIARVGNDWLHLDATRPTGLTSPTRLTLGTHDLSSGNEFETLAGLIGVMGQFDVRVVRSGTQPLAP